MRIRSCAPVSRSPPARLGVLTAFIYVQGGKLTYGRNYVAEQRFKVQSDKPIPDGDHIFSVQFSPTGTNIPKGKGVPAKITLLVDGTPVGSGDLPVTIPLSIGLAGGICVGRDAGSPVMTDYEIPFDSPAW